jgi:hypothetical protein
MPGLLSLQQHCSIGEVETPLAQLMAELMLLTTIHDAEFGQARRQLTAQRKVSAKRAASVVDQREGHQAAEVMRTGSRSRRQSSQGQGTGMAPGWMP